MRFKVFITTLPPLNIKQMQVESVTCIAGLHLFVSSHYVHFDSGVINDFCSGLKCLQFAIESVNDYLEFGFPLLLQVLHLGGVLSMVVF